MTFCETHCAHRHATEYAVFANGFSGVFRAARKEAAALAKHRTNAVLIGFDQAKRGGASRDARASWCWLLLHEATPEPEFGLRTPATLVAASFAISRSSAPVHSAISAPTSLDVIAILKRTTYCETGKTDCLKRNCSRIRRLTALRSTALRAFFLPIISPRRGRGTCVSEPRSARR